METIVIVAQEAFQKAGYQWVENIYNDDNPDNCSVRMTKSINPCAFGCSYPEPDDTMGWGRYSRADAWALALEWLQRQNVHDQPQCQCSTCGHIGWGVEGEKCGACGFCDGIFKLS